MTNILENKEKKVPYALRMEQCRRLNVVVSYLKSRGYFKTTLEMCEQVGINRSYVSSVLTGKYSAITTAKKICKYYNMPYLDWVETGEGSSPSESFEKSVKYLGTIEEGFSIDSRFEKSTLVSMPDNLQCNYIFIFRGKMYFVEKHNDIRAIKDGSTYFIEDIENNKYIKRAYEKFERDRVLELDDIDTSIRTIKMPYCNVKYIYRVIAVLEFTR
jgi:transcriptional regulator with XRE-family HTH domain